MSQAMEKAVQGLLYAMSGIVDIVLLGVEIATDSVLSILTLGSLNNQNTGLTGKYNEGNYELQKFRNGNQYQENLNKLGTRTGAEMHENDAIVDFMITSGLVVASFIPGAAAVTVPALIAYKAMRGAYEGGAGGAAAGAVAGAINTVTQKGGVSVNLGYSYANGYSAGVSVGFGPNGTGPQVGLDWSDKNGFGASVGYGFENGVGFDVGVSQRGGTTYSASLSGKGVPVSLNYSLNVNGGKQTNTFGVSIQLPGTEHFSNVRGSLNYSDRLGLSSGVSYNIGKGESPKPMTEAERAQYNLLDDLIGGLGSVVSGIGRGVKSVWNGVFGGEPNTTAPNNNAVIDSIQNLNNQIEALEEKKRKLNQVAGPYGSVSDLNQEIEITNQIEFLRKTKVQNGIAILGNAEIKMAPEEIERLESTGQLDKMIGIYKKSGSDGLKSYIAGRASGFIGGALEGFFPSFSDMTKNPAEAEAKLAKTIEFLKDKPVEFQAGFLEMRGFGELAGGLLQGYALTKVLTLGNLGRSFSANDIPHSNAKLISSAEVNALFKQNNLSDPFAAGYNAYEMTTSEAIKAVRVFSKDNPYGAFMTLPGEIAGKSASEIQRILGLPKTPTYKMTVEIPAGTQIFYGKVGPQAEWGLPGFGGNQIYIKDRIPMLNYKVLTTERLPY